MNDSQTMIESLFKNLGNLGSQIEEAQKSHQSAFKQNEPNKLSDLRCCLDGVIASIYNEINEPIKKISNAIEYQLSVSASFVKTHFLLNTLILEGNLIEAFVLLRKQLESLARLEELNSKPLNLLEKTTPNIKSAVVGQAGKLYGALSEIAHFSCFKINNLLSIVPKSDHSEINIFSKYSENSLNCMKLRLYLGLSFTRWMVKKMPDWYPNREWNVMEERLKLVFNMARESGLIEENKQ